VGMSLLWLATMTFFASTISETAILVNFKVIGCININKCNEYFFYYSGPVLQSTQPLDSNICCVMFSPANPTIIAVGGNSGTRILDVRYDPVRYVHILIFIFTNVYLID
jgi:hypothetical protein